MIEFPITLTSGGSVCLPGHAYALALGYTKNWGVYRLAVTASGEWEGLTIRAFWHLPGGAAPESSLVVDGFVDVPASVTAQPGSGCITFEGSDGAKTVTSADLRYRVSANSGTEDGTEPEPGTPAWQQLVDAVHTDATAAEQAKTDAQTAAAQAGASAEKAGRALSDTITAKEDALKAIGDKQTTATQAVDTARDTALKQVEASTKAAQTAASEAATSAGSADQSAQKAAGSLQALKDGIANGDFKGEPGNDGKSPVVTVTAIENGHRVSITDKDGTKTIDVLNGQTGKTGATPALTIGTVSSGDKPSANITGTPENPVLNLMLQPGPQGPAVALDTTLTHEGEAADAKATGDAISAVKARQNILVGTETGNPVSVDDAFSAPLCGLTVYGRSTQDGTPSPDAPVPIVSAGDGGGIAVKVTGKNLLDSALMNPSFSDKGISATQNSDGSYTISGTPSADGEIPLWLGGGWNNTVPFLTIPSGNYYSNVSIFYYDGKTRTSKKGAFTLLESFRITGVMYAKTYAINGRYNFIFAPQLELGSTATSYSPYREQLLTLPTPTGLPGIPVTSGGNYTDQSGQQWVCDEVDLERGVKVQRVKILDIDNTLSNGSINSYWYAARFLSDSSLNNATVQASKAIMCQKFPVVSQLDETKYSYPIVAPYGHANAVELRFRAPEALYATIKDFQQTIVGTKVYYPLATPIETPLTPSEIAAYKALTAYGPDTVVQAGDGAGIKLEYQRDVNIAIKRIEDAVASMT